MLAQHSVNQLPLQCSTPVSYYFSLTSFVWYVMLQTQFLKHIFLHNKENDNVTPGIYVKMSKLLYLNDFITHFTAANVAAK